MSVFSYHPKTHHLRSLGMLFIVAGVIAGSLYFGNVIRVPLTASQLYAVHPSIAEPAIVHETVFPQPVPFDDEGTIISILAGGQGIAVRLGGNRGYVQAYAETGSVVPMTEGFVRIRGTSTEISCAYANTLFEGRCTPTVQIENIELAPILPF